MGFVLGLFIGLVVGWNFLPQPEIVKKKVDTAKKWVFTKIGWWN